MKPTLIALLALGVLLVGCGTTQLPLAIVQPAQQKFDDNQFYHFLRDFGIDRRAAFKINPKAVNRLSEIFWTKLFGPQGKEGQPGYKLEKGWDDGEIGDLLREIGWKKKALPKCRIEHNAEK